MADDRDVTKEYSTAQVVAKLRRLADALEAEKPFRIQIAGERIQVPGHARFSVEHERGDGEQEIEFQLTWSTAEAEGLEDDDDAETVEL